MTPTILCCRIMAHGHALPCNRLYIVCNVCIYNIINIDFCVSLFPVLLYVPISGC